MGPSASEEFPFETTLTINTAIAYMRRDLADLCANRGDPIAVIYCKPNHEVTDVSHGFTEVFGYCSADLVGHISYELLRPEMGADQAFVSLTNRSEKILTGEMCRYNWVGWIRHKAGHWLYAICRVTPWIERGETIGFIKTWELVDAVGLGSVRVKMSAEEWAKRA